MAEDLDLRVRAGGIAGLTSLNDLRLIDGESWNNGFAVGAHAGTSWLVSTPMISRSNLLSDDFMNTSFYIGTNSGINPVPVELVSLSARILDKTVDLRWKTATELNNYGFEIQRNASPDGSFDKANWTSVGFVEGSGTSMSPKSYSYTDPLVAGSKAIRYRLMQIDRDGTTDYSDVVEVVPGESSFSLSQNYPNPFNAQTSIAYSLSAENQVSLKVYDVLGNVVETLADEFQGAGRYVRMFDPTRLNLKPGLYMISLTAGGKVQNKTMMYLP
ncbi:MAG: T9SS type A sorting domain-containing protein [Bacteroidota bacterium]